MSFLKSNMGRMIAVTLIAASTGLAANIAVARQPDMDGALGALQNAQNHLNKVTQNKDGHAAAARKLIAQAIAEVEAGIAFGQSRGE
jgi:hypothetical protein